MKAKISLGIVSPHFSETVEFEADIRWLTDIPNAPIVPEYSHLNVVVSIFYEVVPRLKLVEKPNLS